MLNAETYRKELQEIRKDGCNIGRDRKTHKLFNCDEDNYSMCADCTFNVKNELCSNVLTDWLLEETPLFTLTKFEYLFLEHINKSYGFIARKKDGSLIFSTEEFTEQEADSWNTEGNSTTIKSDLLNPCNPCFEKIKWDTIELYSIAYILENCEVLEDA